MMLALAVAGIKDTTNRQVTNTVLNLPIICFIIGFEFDRYDG